MKEINTYKPDYARTLLHLRMMIFELARHPDVIKKRLISVFTEHLKISKDDFLDNLNGKWFEIYSSVTLKPKSESGSTFYNTLILKRGTTCKKIVDQLINLTIDLEKYLK